MPDIKVSPAGANEVTLKAGTASIGQVTANAGTNLNTSALAKETGGNLATIAGKDFATQTTLNAIKTQTDKLAFDASNYLKTIAQANDGVDIGNVDVASLPSVTLASQATPFTTDIKVSLDSETVYVDNASGQTVDVSVAGTISSLPALAAGTNIIGAVKRDVVNYTKVCKYVALANTNETTVWDPTEGTKFVITDIFVSATAAGTCTFKDGTAGTTFLIGSFAANGGMVSNLQTPIQSATANNNLTATASAATQYITVCGYEI